MEFPPFQLIKEKLFGRANRATTISVIGIILAVSALATGYYDHQQEKLKAELLRQLSDPETVELVACYDNIINADVAPEIPPELSEQIETRKQQVEEKLTTQTSEEKQFFDVSPEYQNAISFDTYYVHGEGERNYDQDNTILLDTSLYIYGSYVTNAQGEQQPLWIRLVNNHTFNNERMISSLTSGKKVEAVMYGIDKANGKISRFGFSGDIINCQKIIVDGEETASIVAILGEPGMSLEGGNLIYRDEDPSYIQRPYTNFGGDCDLDQDVLMQGLGFPVTDINYHPKPLELRVTGPYIPVIDNVPLGEDKTSFIQAEALAFGGMSGTPIEVHGNICYITNYNIYKENEPDKPKIGIMVLPGQASMEEISQAFLQESIPIASSWTR